MAVTLITGGVKSGKSTWALRYAEERGTRRLFIATATAHDDEMRARIARHQEDRGRRWVTREEPRDIAGVIDQLQSDYDVLLIDCLTMWVSNLMTLYKEKEKDIADACAHLFSVLSGTANRIVFVTNEVGMGIIPADPLSRTYQRILGRLNADIAGLSDEVFVMLSGIAQRIK